MNQNEVNKWALEITKEISLFWEKISLNNSYFKKNGFSVFYTPVQFKPKILIIGINPAGNFIKDNRSFAMEDIVEKLPIKHDYFLNKDEDYELASCMRDLFDFDISILKNSVKLNFYYFRTPSEKDLYKQKEFPEIYKFCFGYTKIIIETLKPEKIIAESFTVFDELVDMFDLKIEDPIKESGKRLIQKCYNDNFELIGLIHPSGLWTKNVFKESREIIVTELKKSF